MNPCFEVYKSKDALDWRWRLVAGNGEIVAQSEGYTSRQHARAGLEAVKSIVPAAETRDIDE